MDEKINQPLPAAEVLREDVPTESQVVQKFEEIVRLESYVGYDEVDRVEDEHGLYSLDIMTTGTDGDSVKIEYVRTAQLGSLLRPSTIHTTLFWKDIASGEDIACGSGSQYDFENGEWVEKRQD